MKKNISLILAVFFALFTSNSNAQTAADSAYVTAYFHAIKDSL